WTIPPDHPIAGARFAEQRGMRGYRVTTGASNDVAHARVSRGVGITDEPLVPMAMTVNGTLERLAVHPRRTLLEALRYDLDLIGTKQGCDKGDCGACTVVLNGAAVLSCLTLALDADGRAVKTVESLAGAPHIDPILDCFDRLGGGQCGFCTPGMLMSATALLDKNPNPDHDAITGPIPGQLCPCTAYGPT